jgi:hypothetical protein
MSQTKAQLIDAVDGSITDADIVGLSSSKLSGALPAISAASLTNVPAANITGTLPAISGANLTDVGKLVFMGSATSSSDITTSSDSNAASGLSITWTPKSASNKFIFIVQGGAQQGQSSSTRGAQSLYMDVGNGSGATFYGYIGAFQYDTAYYVPNSGCFVGTLAGWPGSGTATANLYIREQGGNETYTLHDNEGGLSNNVYIFLMEIEP